MRYIRYAFWAILAVILIAIGLANRDVVTLTLLPGALARLAGMNESVQLPLFAVIIGGVATGLLIGFFWEWLREFKQRAEARRRMNRIKALEREVRRLKTEKHEGKDEVLAILDEAG